MQWPELLFYGLRAKTIIVLYFTCRNPLTGKKDPETISFIDLFFTENFASKQ